jgi:hypothetical protein
MVFGLMMMTTIMRRTIELSPPHFELIDSKEGLGLRHVVKWNVNQFKVWC